MKRNILKKYNFLIAFLLSVLGVGEACSFTGCAMYGSPAEEYGTPSARFKVHGTVTSEDSLKIPNIRIVMETDTDYTGINGEFAVETVSFPLSQDFLIEFDDIDGAVNGAFQSKDTLVSFEDPQFVNGDGGWFEGETSKEVDVALKPGN